MTQDTLTQTLVITGVLISMLGSFVGIFINDRNGRLSILRTCRHKILQVQDYKHSSFIIIHS